MNNMMTSLEQIAKIIEQEPLPKEFQPKDASEFWVTMVILKQVDAFALPTLSNLSLPVNDVPTDQIFRARVNTAELTKLNPTQACEFLRKQKATILSLLPPNVEVTRFYFIGLGAGFRDIVSPPGGTEIRAIVSYNQL